MPAAANAAPASAIASRRGSPADSASSSARIANVVPRIESTIDRPIAADQQVSRRSFCSASSSASVRERHRNRLAPTRTWCQNSERSAAPGLAAHGRPTSASSSRATSKPSIGVATREQALGGATAQIALLERIELADTRRLEIRVPRIVRMAGVRQRLGTRDEQRALAGIVVAAEPQRHREPLRGALERESIRRTRGSQLCTARRRLGFARTRPVMRETLGRGTTRLERAAEHEVQRRSLCARQPANERLANAIVIRLDDVVAGSNHARRAQLGDRGGGFVRPEVRGGDRDLPRQRRTVGDNDVQ